MRIGSTARAIGRQLSLTVAVMVVAAGCSSGGAPSAATDAPSSAPPSLAPPSGASAPRSTATVELTIYGAASLKGAFDKVTVAYETAYPGTTLTVSTDSSSALETQIEQGAPADVFLSADTSNPKKLVDQGLAAGDPVTFAANELTIIVPSGNPAGIHSPADLARPGLKIIAAGDAVPITRYANQLVANLGKEAGYPADFGAAYAANIASKEDNVKAVVAKVELGEGDAGIVYLTDATASKKVSAIDIPPSANVPATYDGVVVRASRQPAAATAFLAWLTGPEAQAILRSLGFLPPP